MTTQVVLASTAFGLATVCAAIDADLLGDADRRVLVVTSNVAVPEGAPDLLASPGSGRLVERFDEVVDHNVTIAPLHPRGWSPRPAELPLWERHLRLVWSLGEEPVQLVVESPAADPALALVRVFGDASLVVYADGLMSYGPTRRPLPDHVGCRVEALLHLDLVPGLRPLLLSEWDVPTRRIPSPAFRAVVETLPPPGGRDVPAALVLGQHLAAGGLLEQDEELALYARMVAGCADAGHRVVVFKAHPSWPRARLDQLERAAAGRGVELEVVTDAGLAETWFAAGRTGLVVSCFSTALLTASTLYGLPVAQLGADLMLERLTPYHNSNRIPATLVHALVPELAPDPPGGAADQADVVAGPVDVPELVGAVGFVMQPQVLGRRREAAAAFLAAHPDLRRRYVKRRRLESLGLPGGAVVVVPDARSRTRSRTVLRRARAFGRRQTRPHRA